jgi:hypothetical protein
MLEPQGTFGVVKNRLRVMDDLAGDVSEALVPEPTQQLVACEIVFVLLAVAMDSPVVLREASSPHDAEVRARDYGSRWVGDEKLWLDGDLAQHMQQSQDGLPRGLTSTVAQGQGRAEPWEPALTTANRVQDVVGRAQSLMECTVEGHDEVYEAKVLGELPDDMGRGKYRRSHDVPTRR